MPWRRSLLVTIVTLVVWVPSAAADDPLPAIAQYVESIPTSSGPIRGEQPDPSDPKPRLSPAVENSLQRGGGNDEGALRGLATDPALGAPQQKPVPRVERSNESLIVREALRSGSTPSEGFFGAADFTGGGGNRLPAFLLAMLALTPLLLVFGRRRAKQSVRARR